MPEWIWVWAIQPNSEWNWAQVSNIILTAGSLVATSVLAWLTYHLVNANKNMAKSAHAQAEIAKAVLNESKRNKLIVIFEKIGNIRESTVLIEQINNKKIQVNEGIFYKIRVDISTNMLNFIHYAPVWVRSKDDEIFYNNFSERMDKIYSLTMGDNWDDGSVFSTHATETTEAIQSADKALSDMWDYIMGKIRSLEF